MPPSCRRPPSIPPFQPLHAIMIFRQIEFNSAEYRHERALRDEVLRRPLGMTLDDNPELEREHWHFGLFDDDGTLIGCAVVAPVDAETAKIQQVAIAPAQQRRGHGQQIMCELEARLAAEGIRRFVLHARLYAVGFYDRLGYQRLGEPFTETTLPHVRMEKYVPAGSDPAPTPHSQSPGPTETGKARV